MRASRRARARAQEAREGLRKLEQDAQRLEVRLEATRRALARRAVAL